MSTTKSKKNSSQKACYKNRLIIYGIILITCSIFYFSYENILIRSFRLPSLNIASFREKRFINLNKEFIQRKEKTVFVRNFDVSLKLTDFVYSPCPKGVQCFWSGLDVHYELTVDGKKYVHPGTAQNAPYWVKVKQSDYKTYAKFKLAIKTEN